MDYYYIKNCKMEKKEKVIKNSLIEVYLSL